MAQNKNASSKKDARIKELQAENKRLRAEVETLKYELNSAKDKKIFNDPQDKVRVSFDRRVENTGLFSKRSYTSYLLSLISKTSVFKLYKKIINIVKKYTLITVSLQIAAYILTVLQSSAIFVVAFSLFVISLPFTFIFGYSALVFSFFGRKKINKKVDKMLQDKKVAVFFATKSNSLRHDSFFAGMVREWRDKNNGVAVIVSPYFFSSKGISSSKRPYMVMREEEKDIILVRRHYYFSLKKRRFTRNDKNLTLIY